MSQIYLDQNKRTLPKISIQLPTGKTFLLFTVLSVTILGAFWTGLSSLEERVVTLRYLLLILTALIAFSTPYLLFPDRNTSLLQLGNMDEKFLTVYLIKRILKITWPVILLLAILLFADLNHPLDHLDVKGIVFLNSILFFTGLVIFSVTRYSGSGLDSQFWKESEKGKKLRMQMADYFKYPIDPGSIPSLLNTILIVSIGSLLIVSGSNINQTVNIYSELLFMFVIFISALLYFRMKSGRMVINYYATNAFFLEFFGSNMKGEDLTLRREVNQLWWVPTLLKAHVWQYLVQLDRKVPAGRVVAAGHLLVWFIAYQKPDPEFLSIVWLIFALLHHFFTFLTIGDEMSPGWLFRWIGSTNIWLLSRFWMQLRWLIPLLISMNLQLFIFGTPDFQTQSVVLVLFIISSLLVSIYGATGLKKEVN